MEMGRGCDLESIVQWIFVDWEAVESSDEHVLLAFSSHRHSDAFGQSRSNEKLKESGGP